MKYQKVPKSRSVSSCDWYSLVDLCLISILIHHFHIDHHASCLPPKVLHNHCFQFLLGITVVPREYKENSYAKIWGVNKVTVYVNLLLYFERCCRHDRKWSLNLKRNVRFVVCRKKFNENLSRFVVPRCKHKESLAFIYSVLLVFAA